MSEDQRRKYTRQKKWKRDPEEQRGHTKSQADAAEKDVKNTEALIRSLIVEERRRITPSLFPELEPANEDMETAKQDEDPRARKSLNQSVREILQAEQIAGDSCEPKARSGLLSRAFTALRRKPKNQDDIDLGP